MMPVLIAAVIVNQETVLPNHTQLFIDRFKGKHYFKEKEDSVKCQDDIFSTNAIAHC